MIEGLDNALAGFARSGIRELRELLEGVLGGPGVQAKLIEQQMLRSHANVSLVYRLRFGVNGHFRSLIVKRVRPENTRRSELAARRWLPAIGLGEHGPALLATAAERNGTNVWHVYEDLGENQLDCRQLDQARVGALIELIAQVHTRFAGHPLLGEVRLHGRELGIHFFETNVHDAMLALEACEPPEEHRPLHGRILQRLYKLHDELPARAQVFEEWSGPETLLHGDLWHTNVIVVPGANGFHARLIDWDLSGIGPASYDLSTFLLRFAPCHRNWILDAYTQEVTRAGWRLPPEPELNLLFDTAECSRYTNRVIWPAIAISQDRSAWGWEELTMVDQWFEELKPVLPLEPQKPTARLA